ncbi:MAG: TetR/AcrR family transcriptional regulator [Thermoleophilia bacterium]
MSPKKIITDINSWKPGQESPGLREHLVAAAERVIIRKGFASITVREIAREAGVADGTLYNHFPDKEEVLVEAILGRMTEIEKMFSELPRQAGKGTVTGNLKKMAVSVLDFEWEAMPLLGSLHTEPKLMKRLIERLHADRRGPHGALDAVREYLRDEQKLGRIDSKADPDAAAMLLVGTLHDMLLNRHMLEGDAGNEVEAGVISKLVKTLMRGIGPR